MIRRVEGLRFRGDTSDVHASNQFTLPTSDPLPETLALVLEDDGPMVCHATSWAAAL